MKEVFKMFTYDDFCTILNTIKPGTFTSILYKGSCPVKAEFKKQGYTIECVTDAVVRFHLNYAHIKGVVPTGKKSPYTRVDKNTYTCNGKKYFAMFPSKMNKAHKTYFVSKNGQFIGEFFTLPEEYKNMIQASYLTTKTPAVIKYINVDNVLYIGNKNTKNIF